MTTEHLVYISVGSNMGDRLENCRQGIDALAEPGTTAVAGRSRYYRTEPVDYTDQDWFVNAVAAVRTVLEPEALLKRMQAIQDRAGRQKSAVRFGPRILDLDILLYDDRIMDSPALTIPHPRMHKRRFVLRPICDIDPDIVHPVIGQTVIALLNGLDAEGQAVMEVPCDC